MKICITLLYLIKQFFNLQNIYHAYESRRNCIDYSLAVKITTIICKRFFLNLDEIIFVKPVSLIKLIKLVVYILAFGSWRKQNSHEIYIFSLECNLYNLIGQVPCRVDIGVLSPERSTWLKKTIASGNAHGRKQKIRLLTTVLHALLSITVSLCFSLSVSFSCSVCRARARARDEN